MLCNGVLIHQLELQMTQGITVMAGRIGCRAYSYRTRKPVLAPLANLAFSGTMPFEMTCHNGSRDEDSSIIRSGGTGRQPIDWRKSTPMAIQPLMLAGPIVRLLLTGTGTGDKEGT